MKKKHISILAATAAVALTFVTATPASASTYNGHVNCTGSPYTPRLTLDLQSTGSGGTWTNGTNGSQHGPISTPAGHSLQFAPFVNAFWVVSGPFYWSPTQTCA